MRVLIAALLLITTLVIAGNLAASYLALSRVASALPVTLPQLQPIAAASPAAVVTAPAVAAPIDRDPIDPATTGEDESESARARNARALHAATAADPEIAALVDDSDPKVRSAMRAFFEDAPNTAAKP